jgi:hypothetical protein
VGLVSAETHHGRKEVIAMKYVSPKIFTLEVACTVVRGTEKMGLIYELTEDRRSISAYEADE